MTQLQVDNEQDFDGTADDSSPESAPPTTGDTMIGESAPRLAAEEGLSPAAWAGAALVTVGLILLGFFAYLFLFTPVTASRNQQRLTQTLVGHPLTVYQLVGGHLPAQGSAVAVIEIPAIGVKQVVVVGTSAADLMNGPGLMKGTAFPGSPGNTVIAGRRTTFGAPFGSIDTLHMGDRITVVDGAGTFHYITFRTETVSAGRRDVVGPTATNRLTLVTAGPGVLPTGRSVVQARLVGTAVAVDTGGPKVPTTNLGLTGDSVARWLGLLWIIVTVALVLLALGTVTRWRRPWLTYLFALPIVLMTGLFACEALARALPATF